VKKEKEGGKVESDSQSPTSQSKCLTPLKEWKTKGQQKTNLVVVLNHPGRPDYQKRRGRRGREFWEGGKSGLFGARGREGMDVLPKNSTR